MYFLLAGQLGCSSLPLGPRQVRALEPLPDPHPLTRGNISWFYSWIRLIVDSQLRASGLDLLNGLVDILESLQALRREEVAPAPFFALNQVGTVLMLLWSVVLVTDCT